MMHSESLATSSARALPGVLAHSAADSDGYLQRYRTILIFTIEPQPDSTFCCLMAVRFDIWTMSQIGILPLLGKKPMLFSSPGKIESHVLLSPKLVLDMLS